MSSFHCNPLSPGKDSSDFFPVERFCLLLIIVAMAHAVGMLLCVDAPMHEVSEIHSLPVHQEFVLFIDKYFSLS